MRILHLSDIHVWQYNWNPLRLLSKRAVGMASLVAGRARRFRLERLESVVERAVGVAADHVLITGDLTTTALASEFDEAARRLAPLLEDPARATVIPGNHDRYTPGSLRSRAFERRFGAFMPRSTFPWVRRLDDRTAILGLDATRPHLSATGRLPAAQLERVRSWVDSTDPKPPRLVVASHYPILAPAVYREELGRKRLVNADQLRAILAPVGPHLYCCGHVHAAWAHRPRAWPDHLCLNAGAPLLRDKSGLRPPGFLEIELHDATVSVIHHAWLGDDWAVVPLIQVPQFFVAATSKV
ncbi:MAG: metallophosphoesterase [Isosphaeraceae bacterium]|nr:metallophosphoesterase [Isosphaeraceae bacterium]